MAPREVFVRLHRYVGLALALFLMVSGLTGSVIAFNHELDELFNPSLFHAHSEGEPLPPLVLAERVEAADPRLQVVYLPLEVESGHSLELFVEPRLDPATGEPFALGFNEIFLDPATGEVLGRREWGAVRIDVAHLMPFLYQLHMTLHLPETVGYLVFGIIAIIWMFDCFVGFYLTLPRGRPFFVKWKPAWLVKRGVSAYRLNLDLHRAFGLWLWGLLLAMAVSGISLNLYEEVFEPVVSTVSPITPTAFDQRIEAPPPAPVEPGLDLGEALARAEAEAARRGWTEQPFGVFYSTLYDLFAVGYGEEHAAGLGSPWLYLDGQDGRPMGGHFPGEGTAGDFFRQLQFPLHSGQIAGLPGRIVISLVGLAVAFLSITGVVIWLKKRRATQRSVRTKQGAVIRMAADSSGSLAHPLSSRPEAASAAAEPGSRSQ